MYETPKESGCYQQYLELGGIIDEEEYKNIKARMETGPGERKSIEQVELQAKLIAEFAGIELNEDGADKRVVLYGILRADSKPEETKHHHSQMSDQRLFAEALRILEDSVALNKLIDAYHKAGTYCPICLKIAAPGDECR